MGKFGKKFMLTPYLCPGDYFGLVEENWGFYKEKIDLMPYFSMPGELPDKFNQVAEKYIIKQ